MTKTVHILYFASLREERGISEESLQTTAGTPLQLYQELRKCHGFTLEPRNLKIAINDEFQNWDTALNDRDQVAFLPPVAGG